MHPDFKGLGLATIKCFLFVSLLSFLYNRLGGSLDPILTAFLVNCVLAFCFLLFFSAHGAPFTWAPKRKRWFLVPLFFLLIILGLGIASSNELEPQDLSSFVLPVLLVPIVEEIVFRMGLWVILGKISDGSKLYLTAVSFAGLHASSSNLPLGPFLLGLISQWMLLRGAGLSTVTLLHMACNATIVIFLTLDPRWLDWLKIFYINP
jgi:membrane protease YdiL (CAAX protease family)